MRNDISTKSELFEFPAVRHSYDSRGRGKTTTQYLLSRASHTLIRLDRVPGAQVLSTAADLPDNPRRCSSADRHSETRVAVALRLGDRVVTVDGVGSGGKVTRLRQVALRGAREEMVEIPLGEPLGEEQRARNIRAAGQAFRDAIFHDPAEISALRG